MQSNFKKKPVAKAVSTLVLTATLAALPLSAHALGLGRLTVTSTLNAPFEAEIELLSVTEGDLESLQVGLATRSDFQRVGVERRPVLSMLQFEPAKKPDGTPYIRITSNDQIAEPFLQFLVTADYPGGKSSREYTALLDPPLYAGQSGGSVAPVSPTITSDVSDSGRITEVLPTPGSTVQYDSTTVVDNSTLTGTPYMDGVITGSLDDGSTTTTFTNDSVGTIISDQPTYSSDAVVTGALDGTQYGPTQDGDTLWNIAASIDVPGGVSVYQVMLALLRENPQAFINGNVNRLRTGEVLSVPTFQSITSLSDGEARDEYISQLEAFENYRVAVSGSSSTRIIPETTYVSEPEPEVVTSTTTESTTTGVTKSAEDLLRIVQNNAGGEPNTSGTGKQSANAEASSLKRQITALEEEALSKDLENRELKSRVAALESRIEKASRLAEIESETASRLQQQAKERQARLEQERLERQQAEEDRLAQEQLDKQNEGTTAGTVAAVATGAGAAVVAGAKETTGNIADKAREIAGVDDQPKREIKKRDRSAQAVEQPEQPEAEPKNISAAAEERRAKAAAKARKTPASRTAKKAEPEGLVDKIMSFVTGSWTMIAGIGLAVLGLLGFVVWRRRKSIAEFEESILSGSALDIQTDTQETANTGTATDTSFLSEFGVPGMGTMQADEVDPIAEAEVYMAYGRDEQAEEVLKEAISRDGNRPELKLKLLEIYQQRSDVKEFETLAEELYPAQGAENSEVWAKVVEMGQKLNPDNPLFKGGVLAAGAAAVGAAVAGGGDAADDLEADNPFPPADLNTAVDDELDSLASEAEKTHPKLDPFNSDDDDGTTLDFDAASEAVDTSAVADAADDLSESVDNDLDFDMDFDKPAADAGGDDDDDGMGLGGLAAMGAAAAAAGGALAAGVGGAGEAVADTAGGLGDMAGDAVGGLGDMAGDAVDGVGDLAGGAMDSVSGGLDSLGDAVGLGGDDDGGLDLGDSLDIGGDDGGLDIGLSSDDGDLSGGDLDLSLGDDDGGLDLNLDAGDEGGLDLGGDLELGGLDLGGDDGDGGLDLGLSDDAGDLDLGTESISSDLSLGDDDGGLSLGDAGGGLDLGDDLSLGDVGGESNVTNIEDAATKLDLAKAYIDMGDKSGAQSIIDEVLEQGDDGQRKEAAELKAQISAA